MSHILCLVGTLKFQHSQFGYFSSVRINDLFALHLLGSKTSGAVCPAPGFATGLDLPFYLLFSYYLLPNDNNSMYFLPKLLS